MFSHAVGGAVLLALVCTACSSPSHAQEFLLPRKGKDAVVGTLEYARVGAQETLVDIARDYSIGQDQIVQANSIVNRWLPDEGSSVLIPSLYILPPARRRGVVLNLAELRLYYFPPKARVVMTFPVSIGKMAWGTPITTTKIVRKEINPAWTPPRSIREEHEARGEILPNMIAGGHPENPLGPRALRLGIPGYLIHGTDERKSFGVGMRVTHGCIRMYPEDIAKLFSEVSVGTQVQIVDEPIKLGWRHGDLFLSVNRPLTEDEEARIQRVTFEQVLAYITSFLSEPVEINLEAVEEVFQRGDGVPEIIN